MLDFNKLLYNISVDTGLQKNHIIEIIKKAPVSYKVFYIKKRSGGMREIAQPSRDVKLIQRWLINNILIKNLPVADATTAYKTGSSIKINASNHKNSNYLMKLDFKNFFTSIKLSDIYSHFDRFLSFSIDEKSIDMMSRLCSWEKSKGNRILCIGAPTSPIISNSILYDFDQKLSSICSQENAIYTRYADDITISCETYGIVDKYLGVITNLLIELEYPTIIINDKKTIFASRSGRRNVTGITLTPTHSISIGRVRKRLIRAMYHRYISGSLDAAEEQKLNGLIAFSENIEAGFTARLKKKK
jgi:hypothetical protein